MSGGTQSIVFNAVPLFLLSIAYAGMALATAPRVWRQRARLRTADLALALVFPCVSIPAAVLGASVASEREPLGGHVWASFAVILVALLPALLFLTSWREGALAAMGGVRARQAEEVTTHRRRELEAVTSISTRLARAHEPDAVADALIDEVAALFGLEVAALATVDDDRAYATLVRLRSGGEDLESLQGTKIDLEREPSGVASAVFEAAPFAVYDAAMSSRVSRRLVEAVGAKSAAYVPLIAGEQVIAVLVAASTSEHRTFGSEELGLMQTLASEAALALERTRSASELAGALERERLIAGISRKVRSELDVDALLRVAVAETGRGLGVQRCFIRLGASGEELSLAAEWGEDGVEPIGARAARLAVSNLAARDRRTVAVSDVRTAPQLADESLGGREALLELGALAVLATPIVVFGETIGIFGLHRGVAAPWSSGEIALAEAVAREAGLALHTARLLRENAQRIEQQSGLLLAAQALTGELELESVLERLVEQVAQLLGAEAADCYLLLPERGVLRCAAVYGLDPGLVGFEFPAERGVAGEALRRGRPVLAADYERVAEPVPHDAYAGFTGALVAPMVWSGTVRGVLGVGAKGRGRTFSEADADLLEAFAGLASLALRNAESFAERSRQARIQRGFYRIASALGQPLSLAETLDAVGTAAGEALGGHFAAVLVPRGDTLVPTGARVLPAPFSTLLADGLPPAAAALVTAARDGRVLAAGRLADDDRFEEPFRRQLVDAGFRAALAVPVAARGQEGGLVLVLFAEERTFGDDDLELARHLAGATRAALERSALFEAERTSRALAQQLARTGSLLATELDPAAVLDEVVQRAPALLDAEACTIRVLEGDELVVSAGVGAGADEAIGAREPATGWLSAEVVQSRTPLAIADLGDGGGPASADALVSRGYRSFLGVPLVGPEGAVHGVLAVYGFRPRAWQEEEIEALSALAANTSAALSNAELYQRVADEKERSSAIIENIADGIVAVDRDGEVVLWNRAAAQITGVPREEALGRTPVQVLRRQLESDVTGAGRNRLVSIARGGEEVWLSLTEAVMRDPAGQIAGRIFAFRDISADRYVEELKSDFVSAVSHELRSPLTSIYGFAETLLRQDVLFGDEERRTFLGYIASESERLTAIVDALLNVARLDSGDLQVRGDPVDVNAVVSEAVSTAESTSAVNAHRFVVDLPAEPVTAKADRDKLRQILSVLLENAVKYSPEGGTVTVSARPTDETVRIEVADEGIGIPPHEQERIFRKFYRAEGAARERGGGGTGLGLFIAQGLVEAMGGRIWVDSTEGEGACFGFELPLARAPVPSVRE